ncbi:hypothetical protein [Zunongwangia sp.]|uniref:hypothetical protein n=1 Tax=Zunongwangia sp. TaxID=1965325 RepID=UPI003AA9AB0F
MEAVFTSKYYAAYQCNQSRKIYIDFGQKTIAFTFCQLLAFRHKLNKLTIEDHINGSNKHGIEILSLCNRQHILIFNTLEVLDAKELLIGTFAMFELQSILY